MCVSKCGIDEHRAVVNPIQSDWYSIKRYKFVRSVNEHGVMILEVLLAVANGLRSASAASAKHTMIGGANVFEMIPESSFKTYNGNSRHMTG